jgi:hypothetical protein
MQRCLAPLDGWIVNMSMEEMHLENEVLQEYARLSHNLKQVCFLLGEASINLTRHEAYQTVSSTRKPPKESLKQDP